jgi:Subtilase family
MAGDTKPALLRTHERAVVRAAALIAGLSVASTLAGCGLVRRLLGWDLVRSEAIYSTSLVPAHAGARATGRHPSYAPIGVRLFTGTVSPAPPRTASDKIDPVLASWLGVGDPHRVETLIVTLRDTVVVPSLEMATRDTITRGSVTTTALIAEITRRRTADYTRVDDRLFRDFQVRSVDRSWLLREIEVDLPLDAVPTLATWDQVDYIEPRFSRDRPPTDPCAGMATPDTSNSTACDDPIEGRTRLGTDSYLDAGFDGARIGLVDTGVRSDHAMFFDPDHPDRPDRLDFLGSCANSTHTCTAGVAPGADVDDAGHGTCSAGLLTGNGGPSPDRHHGFSRATVDAFRVYRRRTDDDPGIDRQAAVHAIEDAMAREDHVILVESQTRAASVSALSEAADKALANGYLVVAPTGNLGADRIGSPANARAALAVGDYDIFNDTVIPSDESYESRSGHQNKPDLIAPTRMETASNEDPPSVAHSTRMKDFPGTSGAAPGATGAAALLWQAMANGSPVRIEPGHVWAALIACSDASVGPGPTTGAGKIALPQAGHAWFGAFDLDAVHPARDVLIDPSMMGGDPDVGQFYPPGGVGAPSRIDVAIWWPEGLAADLNGDPVGPHGVVTLLVTGSGTSTTSAQPSSVWQRVEAPATSTGSWTIHVSGETLSVPRQHVYWFACLRP